METPDEQLRSTETSIKVATLGTKLGLLLNPKEEDSSVLLKLIGELPSYPSQAARLAKDADLVRLAHSILKAEWVRLKNELQD